MKRILVTLGWEPKVTLDEGLDHIIAYFRDYLAK